MNTSPLEDKAAIVSSQLVIFEICESLTDWGGRYGCIPLGKVCMGKLCKSKLSNMYYLKIEQTLFGDVCRSIYTLRVSI